MWIPISAFTALLLIGGVVLMAQKKRLEELKPKILVTISKRKFGS
jgi:hypothetical protein